MALDWRGVMPAVTTPFDAQGAVDHAFLGRHCGWMLDHGCTAIIALGSLGEGATLTFNEKRDLLERLAASLAGRAPLVAAVAALSTVEAVALARAAERAGCEGLMVLPPYVYRGPWHEIRAHFSAVFEATGLSCMLYNNPVAYGTDVTADQMVELFDRHPNLHAVKESSGDVRRITAARAALGDRATLSVGVDDLIVEGAAAGAEGWVAGLVNALPGESVALFEAALRGDRATADPLYEWFLPLLRLDTVPEFVHLIKLVQQEVGMGTEAVRPPRRPLQGAAREAALATIRSSLAERPKEPIGSGAR
jgi:1-pyrroline-4-hydroxy-2-carboxylate deaminase